MQLKEIRETYLKFFESKGHKRVPSAPMVIKDDPTLMFTNAGMNQFKDLFLGNQPIEFSRAVDSQKCLRVSGKHNDLEEVGVDTYHHTMFEMLGNWSFGDYFKAEAIEWSWAFLTEELKLDKDRLYVTVFEGDQNDGTALDEEAIAEWKKWINEDRILKADKSDNFWEMGDQGPCGPCSEIHYDARPNNDREKIDGRSLVNQDHPQVIEIWNLVFMEYNRKADGSLISLPNKHIDTGMGLERLAMVIQGKTSNYDTDLFQKLINVVAKEANVSYGKEEHVDIALRVVSDHIRAIAFSIADGQLPSNTGAGYVIRRILRRAVRYGYQTLNLREAFLYKMIPTLIEEMGEAFPELVKNQEIIGKVIQEEENAFFKTLEQGLKKIESIIEETKSNKKNVIDGQAAFELFDTFGFPYDLTALIARENDLSVDEIAFNTALDKQKNRSKAAAESTSSDWVVLREDDRQEFIGYDHLSTHVYLVKYREVQQKKRRFYQLVFNITPFYPEGGGQVGDRGWIESEKEKIEIFDTKKENNLTVHFANEIPKNPKNKFLAVVDKKRRIAAASNHSATHLLHMVLADVLGDHVEQKGSLVAPDYLRFDFSHFSKVSEDELQLIEKKVNELIRKDEKLSEIRDVPVEKAMEMGAKALFGEKYGDVVRVVKFGRSMELCGGTHVDSTARIGTFIITSESSVASGIRRIEAISSEAADEYIKERLTDYNEIKQLLKAQGSPLKQIKDLIEKQSKSQKEIESLKAKLAQLQSQNIADEFEEVNGVQFLGKIVDMDAGAVKNMLFDLKKKYPKLVAGIGIDDGKKAILNILIGDEIVSDELNAGNLVRELAQKHIKGSGGGQPFFATAGGGNPSGLSAAIEELKSKL